jgi:hypothetical protein
MVAQSVTEATGSPIAGMVAGATTGAAGGLRPKKLENIPTAQELKQQANMAYQKANKSGVVVKPASLQAKLPEFKNVLKIEGFDAQLHPQIKFVIERLETEINSPKTLQEMETLRRIVKSPTKQFDNPDQQRIAYKLLEEYDNYVSNLSKNDLAPVQNPEKAFASLKEARSLYSKSIKSDTISDLIERAEITAGANYTQSGLENALRQELKSLAKNPKRMNGFTKTEKDAIIAAAKGGNLQNFLRYVGKLAPTSVIAGGGAAGLGYLAGGTTGAIALPLIGGAGRYAATQMGMRNMRDIQNLVALGREPSVVQSPYSLVPQTAIRGLLSTPDATNRFIQEENPLGF